jgi:hypothetical protein
VSVTFTLAQLLAQTDVVAQTNADDVSNADRQAAVKAALEHYSRDFPWEVVGDVTGNATAYYALNATALARWSDGFSQVQRIEYPAQAVSANAQPQYLDREDWRDDYYVNDPNGVRLRYLYLRNYAPAATETLRITYTAPRVWTTDQQSVESTELPAQHFYAFSNLAGHYVCRAVAAKYSKIGDSTLDVDSASHTTKAQEFAARARELLVVYRQQLALPDPNSDKPERAAGVFLRFNLTPDSATRRRFLHHDLRR